ISARWGSCSARRRPAASRKHLAQVFQARGLAEQVVDMDLLLLAVVWYLPPASQHDDGGLRCDDTDASRHLTPVNAGHAEVGHDRIEWLILLKRRTEGVDSLLAARSGDDRVPLADEDISQRTQQQCIIIHQEQPQGTMRRRQWLRRNRWLGGHGPYWKQDPDRRSRSRRAVDLQFRS